MKHAAAKLAKSIGYSMGPSGAHLEKLITQLGIENEVRPKLKQAKTGREVGKLIANGEVEIGFQPISELVVQADGVDFVGGLPTDIQSFTVYVFVAHSQATDEKSVQELRHFLQSSPVVQAEPPRVCRRLQLLRRWSPEQADKQQVFA